MDPFSIKKQDLDLRKGTRNPFLDPLKGTQPMRGRLAASLKRHRLRKTKETMQQNNRAPRRATQSFGSFVSFVMTVPKERLF